MIVLCLIVIAVVGGAAFARRRRQVSEWREMSLGASRGDGPSVDRLGRALSSWSPRAILAAFPGIRPALNHHTAPALARALGHRSPAVAAACAETLGEMGSTGLRAVWAYWSTAPQGPGRSRARTFLLEHPDWLFSHLLQAFAEAPEGAPVPHEDLWRDGDLAANLAGVVASGDPELASVADRLRRELAGRAG